jgi:transcription-repair coupling factor (superfamily II helicase)
LAKLTFHPFDILFDGLKAWPQGPFSGVHGALASLLLAHVARQTGLTLVVAGSVSRARELAQETMTWMGASASRVALFLPTRQSVYDQTPIDPEVVNSRLAALSLEKNGGGIVVTTFPALLERFADPRRWQDACLRIIPGATLSRDACIEKLVLMGYDRTHLVEEPRQFAVRGSILDIYAPDAEFPIRLDFFGDELETIKTFSPETQRTLDKLKEFNLVPVRETVQTAGFRDTLAEAVRTQGRSLDETRRELLDRRLERLFSHPDSEDERELMPFIRPSQNFLWDFWAKPRIVIENPEQFTDDAREWLRQQEHTYQSLGDVTPLLAPAAYYHEPDEVFAGLQARGAMALSRFKSPERRGLVFDVEPAPAPNDPSRESLLKDLKTWIGANYAVIILISDTQRFHNLKGLLGERHFPIKSSPHAFDVTHGHILLFQGAMSRGFTDRQARLVVLCEDDLYQQTRVESKPAPRSTAGHAWSIAQLIPGDLVVHTEHGVAEYCGVQTMTAGGYRREYLLLQYAGSDKLYVPIDQVHKVQKYIGMEGVRPSIHSLNSKVWEGQKRRVRKNVENIARELLELYARRQAGSGFAFLPDTDLQKDMETRFSYTETPDQHKAIEAVKTDMEEAMPMDRLVCGDVGYGKTEVAIRAAFKAVCSGKQVAVLAPTTLLAFQHQQTFLTRMEGFPVRIGMVSRLVPARESKKTLEDTKTGRVDILIGTHRLLSKDIAFKDLGLLIVDEEQRFGVKHKERLKELREALDILTLSATPIPRTLHMALSGIRQISVIDTPPVDRRPIHTYVAPFDPGWAKRAIIQELQRGGQVYYVFNRVEKIDQKAAAIRQLVPEARVAIAHGQMEEGVVEKTMLSFIRREFDILLATTIIESGLDIPNVNTLIVDEAERLGLSQMYQLRGRVGRSSRQAWAYFFYSKGRKLTQEAYERLATIEEHTALGSGFKIALRDLQIRGAGNLLGAEQSGHIASVGFNLYIELLEEAVARLRGQQIQRPPETAIEIPVTALFPPTYMPEEDTRIDMYARLSRCCDPAVLELVKSECLDRFGPLPEEAIKLFQVARLRILGALAGVLKVSLNLGRLRFEFDPQKLPAPEKVVDVRVAYYKRLILNPQDPTGILLNLTGLPEEKYLSLAEEFLSHLRSV